MTEMINQDKKNKLKTFIECIERLNGEKQEIVDRLKEVYDEAKHFGLDINIIKKIVAERKKDPSKLEEEQYLFEVYKDALGGDSE